MAVVSTQKRFRQLNAEARENVNRRWSMLSSQSLLAATDNGLIKQLSSLNFELSTL